MKIHKLCSLLMRLVLVLSAVFFFSACSKYSSMIVGKWKQTNDRNQVWTFNRGGTWQIYDPEGVSGYVASDGTGLATGDYVLKNNLLILSVKSNHTSKVDSYYTDLKTIVESSSNNLTFVSVSGYTFILSKVN